MLPSSSAEFFLLWKKICSMLMLWYIWWKETSRWTVAPLIRDSFSMVIPQNCRSFHKLVYFLLQGKLISVFFLFVTVRLVLLLVELQVHFMALTMVSLQTPQAAFFPPSYFIFNIFVSLFDEVFMRRRPPFPGLLLYFSILGICDCFSFSFQKLQ